MKQDETAANASEYIPEQGTETAALVAVALLVQTLVEQSGQNASAFAESFARGERLAQQRGYTDAARALGQLRAVAEALAAPGGPGRWPWTAFFPAKTG